MPSRRKVLSLAAAGMLSPITGCASSDDDPLPVAVLLHNDATEAQKLRVSITGGSGEQVFETEKAIRADDGTSLGRIRIDEAFEGVSGDNFTVKSWFDGGLAGTFQYEVTCSEDNYIVLLVEHSSHRRDGEPVHYNAHWCAE